LSDAAIAWPIFRWPVRVYYEDTDIGGVVYYANYLKYLERARTEWLRTLGIDQLALAQTEDIAFVVRRAEIDYRLAARMDDSLVATAQPIEVGRASLWLTQEVWRMSGKVHALHMSGNVHAQRLGEPLGENPDTGEGELICAAKIQVACIRRNDHAVRPFPKALQAALLPPRP
jgi:acyl-CoA thioester hydrolase